MSICGCFALRGIAKLLGLMRHSTFWDDSSTEWSFLEVTKLGFFSSKGGELSESHLMVYQGNQLFFHAFPGKLAVEKGWFDHCNFSHRKMSGRASHVEADPTGNVLQSTNSWLFSWTKGHVRQPDMLGMLGMTTGPIYIILYDMILYYIILCYTILYYSILYYIILYYIILLYYTIIYLYLNIYL